MAGGFRSEGPVQRFRHLLTATDGQLPGGGGLDKFRIKIWNKATNTVVYDNVAGGSEDIDSASPQVIAGGSIVIHAQQGSRALLAAGVFGSIRQNDSSVGLGSSPRGSRASHQALPTEHPESLDSQALLNRGKKPSSVSG